LALVLSGAAATANAQTNGEFTATPRSGPAGTKIHIRSVTPCFAPPGVARSEVADVAVVQRDVAVGSAEFDVAGDGSWDGTLVVSTKAVAGAATLTAFCKASPQAEGAILAYTEQPFTVTSGTLARTGSSPLPILLAGLALLGCGALLLRIRPRRT
jgi:hypothetical protein